mgnify:FL=1
MNNSNIEIKGENVVVSTGIDTGVDTDNTTIVSENTGKDAGAKKDIDKISSAKIMESTKDIIKSLNLKGNQQEQLDIITRGYKRYLEEAQKVAKEEVFGLDLTDEFKDFSKGLDVFVKKLELKTNTYMNDTVAVNISNTEKEFKKTHQEFMNYLDEVKAVAISSEQEVEEKNSKIEELTLKVKELTSKVEGLEKENKDLETAVAVKQDKLDKERKEKYKVEHKLETKEVFLSDERLKITNLKTQILELESSKSSLKSDKKKLKEENQKLHEDNKNLEIRVKELELSNTELTAKNNSLEDTNKELSNAKKEVVEKTELATKLESRNKSLEEDLKELNELKSKNVELEGTIKALEMQSKLLETTLNTVNMTITSITESKIKAEEIAITLEQENKKLLEELEKLINKGKGKGKNNNKNGSKDTDKDKDKE